VQNYCKLTVFAKEVYCKGGLMNECALTALATETVVVSGASTATGTLASLVNKCELLVGFQKDGEGFKNYAPCKTVVLEHKVLNECNIRAFADNLYFKQELVNSCVINAYVKEYMLIGESEDSSLINKCVVNVFAYKIGDKSEQSKLVEIQGQLVNECNVVANTSKLWMNDRILNKCNISYVAAVQHKCGLHLPWRLRDCKIAKDPNMTGATLSPETANPMQS